MRMNLFISERILCQPLESDEYTLLHLLDRWDRNAAASRVVFMRQAEQLLQGTQTVHDD